MAEISAEILSGRTLGCVLRNNIQIPRNINWRTPPKATTTTVLTCSLYSPPMRTWHWPGSQAVLFLFLSLSLSLSLSREQILKTARAHLPSPPPAGRPPGACPLSAVSPFSPFFPLFSPQCTDPHCHCSHRNRKDFST